MNKIDQILEKIIDLTSRDIIVWKANAAFAHTPNMFTCEYKSSKYQIWEEKNFQNVYQLNSLSPQVVSNSKIYFTIMDKNDNIIFHSMSGREILPDYVPDLFEEIIKQMPRFKDLQLDNIFKELNEYDENKKING